MKSLTLAALIAIAVCSSPQATADEPPEWYLKAIKVPDPHRLGYWFYLNPRCPLAESDGREIIDAVLLRSHIEPVIGQAGITDVPHLAISLDCFEDREEKDSFFFDLDVRFGLASFFPSVWANLDYGTFGKGQKTDIEERLEYSTGQAIIDFTKGNPGL